MTIFSFIFSQQAHKNNRGYYINHDTLMPLKPEYRSKLIFYFIAEQTGEKLTIEDRKRYLELRTKLDHHVFGWAGATGVFATLAMPLKTSMRTYYALSAINYTIRFIFASGIAYNIFNGIAENRFVARDPIVKELAEKYNFTVYDFALAKKESRIKQLKNHLENGYFFI